MKRQLASDPELEIYKQLVQGVRLISPACAQVEAAAEAARKVNHRRGLAAMVEATNRMQSAFDIQSAA